MDDAGAGAPAPMDRRYSNDECWKATLDYVNSAKEAERLGFDSFWTTEHHFQYEGYEVIPNGLLISTWIAAQTTHAALRRDVQRRSPVEPAAARRGLRDAAQPVGRARHARRRSGHGAPRGAAPERQGRLDRLDGQPGPGRRRHPQPRGVRGVDGDHPSRPHRRSRSPSRASTSRSRFPASPTAARPCRRSRWSPSRSTRSRSGRRSPRRPRSTTCPSSIMAPCSGTSTTASSSGSGTSTARPTQRPTASSWRPTRSACSWSRTGSRTR